MPDLCVIDLFLSRPWSGLNWSDIPSTAIHGSCLIWYFQKHKKTSKNGLGPMDCRPRSVMFRSYLALCF